MVRDNLKYAKHFGRAQNLKDTLHLTFNINTLYSRKTASVEGSKWDVGNIMNDEPIHANSITPDPLSLAAPPIIEGGKLRGAGIYSTSVQTSLVDNVSLFTTIVVIWVVWLS